MYLTVAQVVEGSNPVACQRVALTLEVSFKYVLVESNNFGNKSKRKLNNFTLYNILLIRYYIFTFQSLHGHYLDTRAKSTKIREN